MGLFFNKNRSAVITYLTVIAVLIPVTVLAYGDSSPRAIGMGRAYTALARGYETAGWNPANLGLSAVAQNSFNLFSLSAGLKNNSFTLSNYNEYNGGELSDDDKAELLARVPGDGLAVDLRAEATFIAFSKGRFAITSGAYALSTAKLDKDPFELLLYGSIIRDNIQVENTYGEGYGVADIATSYGTPLASWADGELAIGGTFHFLKGIVYSKVMDARGFSEITDTSIVANGQMRVHTAKGGTGFSGDLGMAIRFNENYHFSLIWQNVFGKMSWYHKTEETIFDFNMEPLTIEDLIDSTLTDSLITSNDTTIPIAAFSSELPTLIRLGFAREYDKLTWAIDWEQSLMTRPGHSVNPKLALGMEYNMFNFMPLRLGFTAGGRQGAVYSTGVGLIMGSLLIDFGYANSGSPIPGDTKGAKIAAGLGFYF